MILLFHITVALLSIASTTLAFFMPTKLRIRTSAYLAGITLISGTYLVISTHAQMIQACTTGLIYLAVISFGIASARQKLAKADN